MHNQRRTVNIHTGRKLSGKSRDEFLEAVLSLFSGYTVHAVQQSFDLVRVTFDLEEAAVSALKQRGVRIFDMWCRMDGGPPTTIVHLFDYPYEEDEESVGDVFDDYGTVKSVRCQKYLSHSNVCTGTCLVDLVLTQMPPRQVIIKGYMCRVWFKGQPLVCNLCNGKGHRAADCPKKDKCRACGASGHFARNCTNAWKHRGPRTADPSVDNASVDQAAGAADVAVSSPGAVHQHPDAEGTRSGGVVDSAVSGVTDGSGESGPAEAGTNGAGEWSISASADRSVADGVLRELFASSVDDYGVVSDDGSFVDITEFPSEESEPPSQIISQFTEKVFSVMFEVNLVVVIL